MDCACHADVLALFLSTHRDVWSLVSKSDAPVSPLVFWVGKQGLLNATVLFALGSLLQVEADALGSDALLHVSISQGQLQLCGRG